MPSGVMSAVASGMARNRSRGRLRPNDAAQGGTTASTLDGLQNTLSTLKLVVGSANEKYGALVRQRVEAEETRKILKEGVKSKAERERGDALNKLKF